MELFIIALVITIFILIFLINSNKKNSYNNEYKIETVDLTGYKYQEDFEVTGIHFNKEYIIQFLGKNNKLQLLKEPDNPVNSEAIKVMHNDFHIGYVCDYDIDEVNKYLNSDYLVLVNEKYFEGTYITLYMRIYSK